MRLSEGFPNGLLLSLPNSKTGTPASRFRSLEADGKPRGSCSWAVPGAPAGFWGASGRFLRAVKECWRLAGLALAHALALTLIVPPGVATSSWVLAGLALAQVFALALVLAGSGCPRAWLLCLVLAVALAVSVARVGSGLL